MPGKLSFVVAIVTTLVIPTAAWSGGNGGSSGGHREDSHRDSRRIGGAAMNHAPTPMKNFGAAASSSTARSSGVAHGSNGAQNVVAPAAGASAGPPRQAFYNRRHFRHRGFFAALFGGQAIGYTDDGECWQWADVPTASGWARQQVWVCDDDERGDRDDQ